MIRNLNANNFEEIVRYIEDLSNYFEEKATYSLIKMYRKFPEQFNQLESDFNKYNEKGDKEDKGFLYQEMMNLEGIRYSLQQNLKGLEDLNQKDELEEKILKLSIKIIYLGAIITFYGKSGKTCEILIKELLEKESQ